jgi:chemotaxis protein CheC
MKLSALQCDAVTELANIGISRAARQLSEILDDEIHMQIPKVELLPFESAAEILNISGGVECVYQRVDGELHGRAALLLHPQDSRRLLHALIGEELSLGGMDLRSFSHEAILEVGNIIISSCVSTIADLLSLHLRLSVPQYTETELGDLIFAPGQNTADQAALLVHAQLEAGRRGMAGHVLLVFSADAASHLLAILNQLTSGSEIG